MHPNSHPDYDHDAHFHVKVTGKGASLFWVPLSGLKTDLATPGRTVIKLS